MNGRTYYKQDLLRIADMAESTNRNDFCMLVQAWMNRNGLDSLDIKVNDAFDDEDNSFFRIQRCIGLRHMDRQIYADPFCEDEEEAVQFHEYMEHERKE